jgi:hypothetical protein
MTNDEILLKLIERIEKHIQGLDEEFAAEETEKGFERDEFDNGYLMGMKSVLLTVKLAQDGSLPLE